MHREVVFAFIAGVVFKVLLIPSYKSTDYEVHRNWLAITYSKPLSEWYYEKTSQWTLDYPPMFAYFEFALAQVAALFDKNMLRVDALEYVSDASVIFQRLSVITSELVLVYATSKWCNLLSNVDVNDGKVHAIPAFISASFLVNVGLIIVDNIHFQYNGFLFGILLLSLAAAFERSYLRCAFWFAVLATLKHIFVYVAPAYVVFLLRVYCLRVSPSNAHTRQFRSSKRIAVHRLAKSKQRSSRPVASNSTNSDEELEKDLEQALQSRNGFNFINCVKLGLVLIAVATAVFGPFVYVGGFDQIQQIFSRLFPFRRGLSHAYWAPNCWALYNFCEKLVKLASVRFRFVAGNTNRTVASLTGGLVGDADFEFLPDVAPWHTFALTFITMLPALISCWNSIGRIFHDSTASAKRERDVVERIVGLANRLDSQTLRLGNAFLKCVALCAFSSFLFGWHVHEKAILLCTVPLTLLAAQSSQFAALFFYLTVLGYYSLFPLLFTPLEAAIKVLLLASHSLICYRLLQALFAVRLETGKGETGLLTRFSLPVLAKAHLAFIPLHYITLFVLYDMSRFGSSLPFVPLMFTSVFCAVGVIACWIWLLKLEVDAEAKLHSD